MSVLELIEAGKYELAIETLTQIDIPKAEKYEYLTKIYLQQGKLEKTKQAIDALDRYAQSEESRILASLYRVFYHIKLGSNQKAESDLLGMDPNNWEELPRAVELQGFYYHLLGSIELIKGETKNAEKYLLRSKDLRSKKGSLQDLAGTINNLGVVYRRIGYVHRAIEMYLASMDIFSRLGNLRNVAMARNNLAIIHASRGEYDQALHYHELNYELHRKNQDEDKMALALSNMGSIYRELGRYEDAISALRQSISYRESLENTQHLLLSVYNLIITLLEYNQLDKAASAIDHFELLLQNNMNTLNKIRYDYITALKLYKQKRLKPKMHAMDKFSKLVDMELIDPDIQFTSLIHLVELMFFEMISLDNDSLLGEIHQLLNQLIEQSKETEHFVFHIKGLLLKAKLLLIIDETSEAETYYDEAYKIADTYKLGYRDHLENEILSFKNGISKWTDVSDDQSKLIDKIKASMITSYLADVKRIISDPTQS